MTGFMSNIVGESFAFMAAVLAWIVVAVIFVGLIYWAWLALSRLTLRRGWNGEIRLDVVDATPIDNRRRLVLVRRDNVEHLIVIGGHNDLVIETGIVRSQKAEEAKKGAAPAQTKVSMTNPKKEPTRIHDKVQGSSGSRPIRPPKAHSAQSQPAQHPNQRGTIAPRETGATPTGTKTPASTPVRDPEAVASQSEHTRAKPDSDQIKPATRAKTLPSEPKTPEVGADLDQEMKDLISNLNKQR